MEIRGKDTGASATKFNETELHPTRENIDAVTRVRRIFNGKHLFLFSLGYMQSWEALSTIIGVVLYNGGPRAMAWGFLPVMFGVACQVLSIAEAAYVVPLAGAQYHWVWIFAPRSVRKFFTWVQGWSTTFSWIALLASVTNISVNIIVSIATANHPSFELEQWQVVILMLALLVGIGLFNLYCFRAVPWIESLGGVLHILLWVIFIVVLWAIAERRSTEFVFFQGSTLSGWDSAIAFQIGNSANSWCFICFEFMSHLAEETRNPSLAVPRAMVWIMFTNACMAFVMVYVLLFTVGDVESVASSRFPLTDICLQATNSVKGSSILIACILFINLCGNMGSVATVSRLIWAWARDGAFPGSSFFAYVDARQRAPLRSVCLAVFIVMLLSLLNLSSSTAFSIIISITTFGLYQSYAVAIAFILHARLTGRMDAAPWSLGKVGPYINGVAIVYSVWMAVFIAFPPSRPITGTNVNYALPLNAFIWILALVTWFLWARKRWNGLDEKVIRSVIDDGNQQNEENSRRIC